MKSYNNTRGGASNLQIIHQYVNAAEVKKSPRADSCAASRVSGADRAISRSSYMAAAQSGHLKDESPPPKFILHDIYQGCEESKSRSYSLAVKN